MALVFRPLTSSLSRIVAAPILSTSCMPPFPHTCLWVNKRVILALAGKSISQLAGFEPTRAEPIGFQVQRLNHSATTAHCPRSLHRHDLFARSLAYWFAKASPIAVQKSWRCGGSNPRPFTCKANALPLSYIPSLMKRTTFGVAVTASGRVCTASTEYSR